MFSVFNQLFVFICRNPAVIPLAGVYLFIFSVLLSYDHAWMHPEQFSIKSFVVGNGPDIQHGDLVRGLNYPAFEYAVRLTRPLSSYFEIIDTKFRAWLWKSVLPHPSLSLTWIFSLVLSPLLLYKFLRELRIDVNLALSGVCLYLLNPGFLSFVVMLFRPAKAMTNFSIIVCLYWGICLYRQYQNSSRDQTRPRYFKGSGKWNFLALVLFIFISFFWDETALLIFPAVLFFFPGFWRGPKRLVLCLSLPIMLVLFYYGIIPGMTNAAGYKTMWTLSDYVQVQDSLAGGHFFKTFFENFSGNSTLLFMDSLGIVPLHPQSPWLTKLWAATGAISLVYLFFVSMRNLRRLLARNDFTKIFWREMAAWGIGLALFLAFHGALMSVTNHLWGLYWYGAYFAVFFVIFAVRLLTYVCIHRYVLTVCLGFILINMGNSFIAINQIYKKFHYYPYEPYQLIKLFQGEIKRYDPAIVPEFTGNQLRSFLSEYWHAAKGQEGGKLAGVVPKELIGTAIETEPGRYYFQRRYLTMNKDDVFNALDGLMRGKDR